MGTGITRWIQGNKLRFHWGYLFPLFLVPKRVKLYIYAFLDEKGDRLFDRNLVDNMISWIISLINLYVHALFIRWMVFYSLFSHDQYKMIWWFMRWTGAHKYIRCDPCTWMRSTYRRHILQILYSNWFTTSDEIGHLIWQGCNIMITMR